MNRKRAALTEEERAERRKREQQLTEQAVAQLRCSAGWQRWLTVRARVGLRRYSLGNQLLIALQDPTATQVAGFRGWLELGYCVRRGSTSHIRVWAPCPPSKRKLQAWRDAGADPAQRPRTHFRLEAVFSQAQVEPLPPPAEPAALQPPYAPLQGDTLAWAREPLHQLADELGYSVHERTLADGHGGTCFPDQGVIELNAGWSVNARVSVLCHELAHALVRHDRREDDPALDYAAEELVAECVIFWRARPRSPLAAGPGVRNTRHPRWASFCVRGRRCRRKSSRNRADDSCLRPERRTSWGSSRGSDIVPVAGVATLECDEQ